MNNLKSQLLYKFNCEEAEEYNFGHTAKGLEKIDQAIMVKFAETVHALHGKLLGVEYNVTVGIKLVDPKKEKWYGAYSRIEKPWLIKNRPEQLFKMMLDQLSKISGKLKDGLDKYELEDAMTPDPVIIVK